MDYIYSYHYIEKDLSQGDPETPHLGICIDATLDWLEIVNEPETSWSIQLLLPFFN